MMNKRIFDPYLSGKKVALLGFGKEGRSSYSVIRRMLPDFPLLICDQNATLNNNVSDLHDDPYLQYSFGSKYMEMLQEADLIIKSPGISYKNLENLSLKAKITSQTEIFLEIFGKQVTGITGTKGKSTTSSLLFHILKQCGIKTVLAGNIGVPPFDLIEKIDSHTRIIFEMSSHQLEHLEVSPHIAVLLNIFQDHLDHYDSYASYQKAKINIGRWQTSDDFFIFNGKDQIIGSNLEELFLCSQAVGLGSKGQSEYFAMPQGDDLLIKLPEKLVTLRGVNSNRRLAGDHNLLNICAAATVATLLGAADNCIIRSISTFTGLPHRLEWVGKINGIDFINDSIATIPEAAIEAIKAWPAARTLLLGGFDRGIEYKPFIEFLGRSKVQNFVLMGDAGLRMHQIIKTNSDFLNKKIVVANNLQQAFGWALRNTPAGAACILSPAAASYDAFRNFEERGDLFRDLVSSQKQM